MDFSVCYETFSSQIKVFLLNDSNQNRTWFFERFYSFLNLVFNPCPHDYIEKQYWKGEQAYMKCWRCKETIK